MASFTVKKQLVKVKVDYIELDDGEILIIQDEDDKKKLDEKGRLKTAVAEFDRPRWSNFNKYIKGCVEIDRETQVPYIDTIVLRDKKFRYLLKSLVDGDGQEVELSRGFFEDVLPDFAIALVEEYDKVLGEKRSKALLSDSMLKEIFDEKLGEDDSKTVDKEAVDKEENSDEKKGEINE